MFLPPFTSYKINKQLVCLGPTPTIQHATTYSNTICFVARVIRMMCSIFPFFSIFFFLLWQKLATVGSASQPFPFFLNFLHCLHSSIQFVFFLQYAALVLLLLGLPLFSKYIFSCFLCHFSFFAMPHPSYISCIFSVLLKVLWGTAENGKREKIKKLNICGTTKTGTSKLYKFSCSVSSSTTLSFNVFPSLYPLSLV